ncbi:MAG: hypothetical protein BMS9Abin07_1955 [Acidimicrobiia bacterium]|nr:MAG: hypothetical protein BMS9Abin07_1955 [Acidimicrobiia bacterium]
MKEKSTEQVRELYDRVAPWWRWAAIPEAILGINRLRSKHFAAVRGDVLDVACGSGENFAYLGGAASVTAVDLSPRMVALARERAAKSGMEAVIEVADAAALVFDDNRFDYVISAMSSCTFPDAVAAFGEMERVTRPGGQILLLEHGRSSVDAIARFQDRSLGTYYYRTGCRYNRDPQAELAEAGLTVASLTRSHLGLGYRIVVAVE